MEPVTLSGGDCGGETIDGTGWVIYDINNPANPAAYKEVSANVWYRRISQTQAVFVGATIPA